MKTTIHFFQIDFSRAIGKIEFRALRAKAMQATRLTKPYQAGKQLNGYVKLNGQEFTIDEMMFNTLEHWHLVINGDSTNFVLSWQEFKTGNTIEGYYLEVTNEMIDYLDNTYVCLNCHKVTDKPVLSFHTDCFHSIESKAELWKTFYVPLSVSEINRKNIYVTAWVVKKWEEVRKAYELFPSI